MKRRYRKPLTERGLRNAERLCALLERADKDPAIRNDKRTHAAIASLAFGYAPRLLADLRRLRQGALFPSVSPERSVAE